MTMYSEYHTTPTLSELDLEFVSSLDRSHSRLSHVVDALQTAVAKGAGVNAVYSALRVLWQYTPTVDITGIALFDSVVNFFQQYPLFLQDAEVLVALTGWLTALVNQWGRCQVLMQQIQPSLSVHLLTVRSADTRCV
ncbi:MAG: uncharacterized protein KVP18_004919 [Porospora cf. gigantea A]|uniref:uncharacterized protein n=1 Tax=Porospora cf. gigantea A TaxID=2853593 RepID=UPI00355A013B|nr:MAG: hypothetical protein KVP18_004919 [Porospora cf. gigantea A]